MMYKDEIEKQQRAGCPACIAQRCHSEEEWKNHPHRGHGLGENGIWSLPELAPDYQPPKELLPGPAK